VVNALYAIAVEPPAFQTALNGNRVDMSINPLRGGGSSGKWLGCHLPGHEIQYRSEYKDLDPRTQAEWAYDLHQFVDNAGGGWDNFRRYQQQGAASNPNGVGGGSVSQDWDRSMISYDKQAQFASSYWDRHNGDKFRHMASMFRDWFIHDSLVDGTLLYMTLEGRAGRGSDYPGYKDAAIGAMVDKK
jgi:hypothetical protein